MRKKKEVWAKVDEGGFYEGKYEVSNRGRWKILAKKIPLFGGKYYKFFKQRVTTGTNSNGYRTVTMKKDRIKKQLDLHTLVAKHFVPNPEGHPFVLHNDDDRSNNYYENLQWGTQKENVRQCFERGRNKTTKGTQRANAKLNDEKVKEMRILYRAGGHTYRSLAAIYSVCNSHVDDIINYRRWKHV